MFVGIGCIVNDRRIVGQGCGGALNHGPEKWVKSRHTISRYDAVLGGKQRADRLTKMDDNVLRKMA